MHTGRGGGGGVGMNYRSGSEGCVLVDCSTPLLTFLPAEAIAGHLDCSSVVQRQINTFQHRQNRDRGKPVEWMMYKEKADG